MRGLLFVKSRDRRVLFDVTNLLLKQTTFNIVLAPPSLEITPASS
jgi:hypothetical protein